MVAHTGSSQIYQICVTSIRENGSRAAKNNCDFPRQENNMDFSPYPEEAEGMAMPLRGRKVNLVSVNRDDMRKDF